RISVPQKTHIPTHYSSDNSLSSYLVDENYVNDELPSDREETGEELLKEETRVAVMATTSIIQSVKKKNMAKPPFGIPGLVKASDGTIVPIKELYLHESYLDAMRYVEANPPEDTSSQVSASSSLQPETLGKEIPTLQKPSIPLTLKSGLMKKINEPISTLRIKKNNDPHLYNTK
ncbi:Hypothetical predicted protein, partial [Pelobates cultripes]